MTTLELVPSCTGFVLPVAEFFAELSVKREMRVATGITHFLLDDRCAGCQGLLAAASVRYDEGLEALGSNDVGGGG